MGQTEVPDRRRSGRRLFGGQHLVNFSSPSGLMDKASVSGAEDCGFESHLGYIFATVARHSIRAERGCQYFWPWKRPTRPTSSKNRCPKFIRARAKLRHPGFEPGSIAWEATMITPTLMAPGEWGRRAAANRRPLGWTDWDATGPCVAARNKVYCGTLPYFCASAA